MALRGSSAPWRLHYLRAVAGTLTDVLGDAAAERAARALARGVFELQLPIRAVVERRIGAALAASESEIRPPEIVDLARASFEHVARFWVELFYLRRRLSATNWRCRVDLPDARRWHELAASAEPLILVTPRAGQPAVAACVLSDLLGELTVPVDPLVFHLAGMQPAVRQRFPRLRLIPAPGAGGRISALLASGGRLLMPTGDDAGTTARPLPFLGRTRPQRLTVARLAIRHRARVATLCCLRGDAPFRFRLALGEILPPPPPGATAQQWAAGILRSLESLILRHPTQYLWTRQG